MTLRHTPEGRRGGQRFDVAVEAQSLPTFFEQFLCENRKPWYLGLVVGKVGAPCGAPDGKGKDKEEFFIWNRHNPLKSLDSDE